MMLIYIDETGIFANPANRRSCLSGVGALVIPEKIDRKVASEYRRTLYAWKSLGQEVKGKDLNEQRVSQVVKLLSKYRLFFSCSIIDLGLHTTQNIQQHKLEQAEKVIENITDQFHPNLVRQLNELKDRIAALSNPLYIQALCFIDVVIDVIRKSVLYYRDWPKALGNFSWRIDRKNKHITEYEDLWKTIACPFLQSHFLQQPLMTIKEGNYRYFRKYENPTTAPPEHLRPFLREPTDEFQSIDLKKLMLEDILFQDSASSNGIQLADILITSVRRACRGTLRVEGWKDIGKLMLRPMKRENSINFIGLGISKQSARVGYRQVFTITDKKAKSLL